MKLKKIEIKGFGKLKDFTLEPKDNLNIIYGENENGKTTVMTFIKCMFYGTGTSKRGISGNIRSKFKPWDGTTMGGRIYFENRGTNYLLEREFKGSDATDIVTLTDKDSGKVLPAGSKVGETLFSLTENAFVRSIFIDNDVSYAADSVANADFNNRLSNNSLPTDGDISSEVVEKRILSTKHKILSLSGRAGSLVTDKEQLNELKEKIETARETQRQMSEISENLEKTKRLAEKSAEEIRAEKDFLKNEDNIKNAQKLKDYIKAKEEIIKIDSSLTARDGTSLPVTFPKIVSGGLASYEKYKARVADLEKETEQINNNINSNGQDVSEEKSKSLNEIIAKTKELEAEKTNLQSELDLAEKELNGKIQNDTLKKAKPNTALIIIGLALIVLSLFCKLFLSVPYLYIVMAAIGILSFVLGFVIKSGKQNNQNAAAEINSKITVTTQKLSSLDYKINALALEKVKLESEIQTFNAIKEQRTGDLKQKQELLEETREKMKSAELEVLEYFSKWKDVSSVSEIEKENEALISLYEKRKELSTALNLYVKDLGDLSLEEAKRSLEEIGGADNSLSQADFEERKAKLENLQKQYSEQMAEITRLETMLATAFSDFVNPETLERELNTLCETINSKEEFVAAANLAIDVLKDSSESMRKNYGSVLENKAKEIFAYLTNGKYSNLNLDNNFEMSAQDKDNIVSKEVAFLSRGTTDQAYLSLRLALSTLLSGDEPLPIMLDDSLSQYDDTRQKTAIEFLNDYSKDNQILLFTCHGIIRDKAKELGANIISAF